MQLNPPYNYKIHVGDCRGLQGEIPDECIDLIMTDPPWDDVNWMGWIAEIAVRILKPGGSLFAMCGKVDLDAAMCAMSDFLDYNWMCVGYQPQSNLQFMPRRIMEKWRPALWYTKGKRKQAAFISDLKSTNRDKRYHPWGQGTSFFMYYMDKIGGNVVFDPFVGGGTTLAVAKMLGKQAFGFELDQETALIAQDRVLNTQIPLIIEQPEQLVIWEE
jgi:DNA modification methylase